LTLALHEIALEETEKLVPVLLDADEDEERIRRTLADKGNTNYAAQEGDEYVGAVTLKWEEHESEILYIAVIRELRGCGYGKSIIEVLTNEMRRRGVHSLLVGTANSSLDNIVFYQKCGFRMYHIRRDFFNYIQPPIRENGILMRDMLVLRYKL
jgi:ribosomal protein S18 acetylase RimI-like enzyme